MKSIFIGLIAIIIGLFFVADTDLSLLLFPFKVENSFKDKVVWIIGASSGIGAQLTKDFVEAGAKVIISSRKEKSLIELADGISEFHTKERRPTIIPFDVTIYPVHANVTEKALNRYGYIDILVLNAGISQRNTANGTPFKDTKYLMDVNFMSLVALTKLILPNMILRNDGHIVVTSSVAGILAPPIQSSYAASKFALNGYFSALRSEVVKHNISVTIACPGPVTSDISLNALRDPSLTVGEEGKKMTTERCTYLMLKGIYYKYGMMIIAQQPFLLFTYLAQYAPALTRLIMNFAGPLRVKALTDGDAVMDAKTMLGFK